MKRALELAIREDDCNEVETDTWSAREVAMGMIVADGFWSEAQGVSCICSLCKGRESWPYGLLPASHLRSPVAPAPLKLVICYLSQLRAK